MSIDWSKAVDGMKNGLHYVLYNYNILVPCPEEDQKHLPLHTYLLRKEESDSLLYQTRPQK